MSEKTEQPTPKKLRDARDEGQVVKSELITRGLQLLTGTLWFWSQGTVLTTMIQDAFAKTIEYSTLPFEQAFRRTFAACAEVFVHLIGSLGMALIFTTLFAGFAQTGFLFAPKKLMPKLDAINPVNNIKNIFSIKKLYSLFRTILMVVLLTLMFVHIFKKYGRSLIYLPHCGLTCAIPVTATLCSWLLWCLIAFYTVFALIDYLFERFQLMKQLKMSKEDIKQEYKDIEGNPEIKRRIREVHEEIQNSPAPSRVQGASAVVRNPTHIAICLYYKAEETPLPMVTEKGAGQNAVQVIELAQQFKIPIFENVPLARQLMATTQIGDYIPQELFEPVAEVLRMAMLELEDRQLEEDEEETLLADDEEEETAVEEAEEEADKVQDESQEPDEESAEKTLNKPQVKKKGEDSTNSTDRLA